MEAVSSGILNKLNHEWHWQHEKILFQFLKNVLLFSSGIVRVIPL
jgi:hypothetical protein